MSITVRQPGRLRALLTLSGALCWDELSNSQRGLRQPVEASAFVALCVGGHHPVIAQLDGPGHLSYLDAPATVNALIADFAASCMQGTAA